MSLIWLCLSIFFWCTFEESNADHNVLFCSLGWPFLSDWFAQLALAKICIRLEWLLELAASVKMSTSCRIQRFRKFLETVVAFIHHLLVSALAMIVDMPGVQGYKFWNLMLLLIVEVEGWAHDHESSCAKLWWRCASFIAMCQVNLHVVEHFLLMGLMVLESLQSAVEVAGWVKAKHGHSTNGAKMFQYGVNMKRKFLQLLGKVRN